MLQTGSTKSSEQRRSARQIQLAFLKILLHLRSLFLKKGEKKRKKKKRKKFEGLLSCFMGKLDPSASFRDPLSQERGGKAVPMLLPQLWWCLILRELQLKPSLCPCVPPHCCKAALPGLCWTSWCCHPHFLIIITAFGPWQYGPQSPPLSTLAKLSNERGWRSGTAKLRDIEI